MLVFYSVGLTGSIGLTGLIGSVGLTGSVGTIASSTWMNYSLTLIIVTWSVAELYCNTNLMIDPINLFYPTI